MAITAVVDTQTGEFLDTGVEPDARFQRKPLSRNPDPRVERWDAVTEFVAKTAPEIAAYDTAQQTARAAVTSRQKDILATIAWAVRARNVAAWTALSPAQKRTAVFAEADLWRDIRVFLEQSL